MGVAPGRYYAAWPSYVVSDDPKQLTFTVAIDDAAYLHKESTNALLHDDDASSRRRYITALTRQRLHQQGFREKVLYAYQRQCACCRLRHEELLDAAHIIPDSDPEGIPSINNGISLCKLHHAAFDSFLIGITPDYHVQVRLDVLNENDGPMLLHGLKNLSGQKIILPKSSQSFPSVELLEKKFEQFRRAG
jgi:putative restriction endonuclease